MLLSGPGRIMLQVLLVFYCFRLIFNILGSHFITAGVIKVVFKLCHNWKQSEFMPLFLCRYMDIFAHLCFCIYSANLFFHFSFHMSFSLFLFSQVVHVDDNVWIKEQKMLQLNATSMTKRPISQDLLVLINFPTLCFLFFLYLRSSIRRGSQSVWVSG